MHCWKEPWYNSWACGRPALGWGRVGHRSASRFLKSSSSLSPMYFKGCDSGGAIWDWEVRPRTPTPHHLIRPNFFWCSTENRKVFFKRTSCMYTMQIVHCTMTVKFSSSMAELIWQWVDSPQCNDYPALLNVGKTSTICQSVNEHWVQVSKKSLTLKGKRWWLFTCEEDEEQSQAVKEDKL